MAVEKLLWANEMGMGEGGAVVLGPPGRLEAVCADILHRSPLCSPTALHDLGAESTSKAVGDRGTSNECNREEH